MVRRCWRRSCRPPRPRPTPVATRGSSRSTRCCAASSAWPARSPSSGTPCPRTCPRPSTAPSRWSTRSTSVGSPTPRSACPTCSSDNLDRLEQLYEKGDAITGRAHRLPRPRPAAVGSAEELARRGRRSPGDGQVRGLGHTDRGSPHAAPSAPPRTCTVPVCSARTCGSSRWATTGGSPSRRRPPTSTTVASPSSAFGPASGGRCAPPPATRSSPPTGGSRSPR